MSRPTSCTVLALLLALLLPLVPRAAAQVPVGEYAARRERLAQRVDSGVVLAFGRRTPVNHWPPFYQNPHFRYLTGFLEPNASFILAKRGGRVQATLFVERADPRRALYEGDRATPAEAGRALALAVRHTDEFARVVDSLVATGLPILAVSDAQSAEFVRSDSLSFGRQFLRELRARVPQVEVREITPWVEQLRARKSPAELALIRTAADISSRAHAEAMRFIRPGMKESDIQAEMEATYRKLGADGPGYTSIVGAGGNSTILHWPASFREAKAGEVVLMDVAAYHDGYSADVTRTVPVNATYTVEQREVYQIVLEAQKAAERNIRPGTPYRVPNDSAYAVLTAGLTRLRLIESPTATFDPPPGLCPGRWANADGSCPQWYLYVYHGFMHGIGLDVHDPAQFSDLPRRTFEEGDAFTIEPGLYVRATVFEGLPDTPRNRALIAHARDAARRYRDTGVRIEDDYALVDGKLERLTLVPREPDEIEALRRRFVP